MKQLKTGQEKIQEICTILRKETLEPAQKDAEQIIEEAKKRADEILQEAQKKAEARMEETRRSIAQEHNVFRSSLEQAGKQALEAIKQSIENKLFNERLHQLIAQQTSDPQVIATLITAMTKAIEKEGLSGDLTAVIPEKVPAKEVARFLAEDLLNQLTKGFISVGDFAGGAKIRLDGHRLTFDLSNKEIEDLVRRYVRKDFRKFIFSSTAHD